MVCVRDGVFGWNKNDTPILRRLEQNSIKGTLFFFLLLFFFTVLLVCLLFILCLRLSLFFFLQQHVCLFCISVFPFFAENLIFLITA